MLYPYVEPRRLSMKLTKKLATLMEEYNASDLGELMDILPDLDLEDYEDELPQQEVNLSEYFLSYKEPAVLGDASYPYGC